MAAACGAVERIFSGIGADELAAAVVGGGAGAGCLILPAFTVAWLGSEPEDRFEVWRWRVSRARGFGYARGRGMDVIPSFAANGCGFSATSTFFFNLRFGLVH